MSKNHRASEQRATHDRISPTGLIPFSVQVILMADDFLTKVKFLLCWKYLISAYIICC